MIGPARGARRPRWIDALLVLLPAFALFHAGLWDRDGHPVEFTLDDDTIVENDPRLDLHSFEDLARLVTDKYWGQNYLSERLWRPVPLVSFAIDRALLGPGPVGFRWTSALLHAVTSLLVLLLLRRLLVARRLALVGALLFAVHPVHAEAVAGVVGRSEVLALLFSLAGWLVHLWARGRDVRGWQRLWPYPVAGTCFFLGFASKEIALTAPFLLVLMELVVRGGSNRSGSRLRRFARAVGPYLLYGGSVGLYFLCRWLVLPELLPGDGAQTLGKLVFEQRLVVATLLGRDVWLALLRPEVTTAHHTLPYSELAALPPPLLSAEVVGTGLAHLALLALGAWFLTRRTRTWRVAGLGLWGFYLSLGPVSNLIPIGVVRADRLLYTPSFYGCALLAVVAGLLFRRQRAFLPLALLVVLLGCAWRLNVNVSAWTNDRLLWKTSLLRFDEEQQPFSAGRCHLALGFTMIHDPALGEAAQGHFADAIRLFARDPRYARHAAKARYGLAVLVQGRDPNQALQLLHDARTLDPVSPDVAVGLARLHLVLSQSVKDPAARTRHIRMAEREARRGTGFAPNSYDLWLLLASARVSLGRLAEAEADYTQAVQRRRAPWQAHLGRAMARAGMEPRNLQGALEDYRAVCTILLAAGSPQRLSPEQQQRLREALFLRGYLASQRKDLDEVRECLKTLQRWFPGDTQSMGVLRKILDEEGGS